MIDILIYGTGESYNQLRKILNWKHINIKAFLETKVSKKSFEGYPVYTPPNYIAGGGHMTIFYAPVYMNQKCEKI